METQNRETLDWDDAIVADSNDYLLLPEGDYEFEVTKFERGRFEGNDKTPACNKAILTLTIDAEDGRKAFVNENLLLVKNLEWKLSDFFRAIGLKRKGEKVIMDWNRVVGSKGMAHVKPRKYTNRNGEEKAVNSVDYYIDYDEAKFPGRDKDGFMNVSNGPDEGLPFN